MAGRPPALHSARPSSFDFRALPSDTLDRLVMNMDLACLPALAVAVPAVAAHLKTHPLRGVLPVLPVLRRPWVDLVWIALLRRRTPLLRWLLQSPRCRDHAVEHREHRAELLALARATGQAESARLIAKRLGEPPSSRSLTGRIEGMGIGPALILEATHEYRTVMLSDGVVRAARRHVGHPRAGIRRDHSLATVGGLGAIKITRMSCGRECIVVLANDGRVLQANGLDPFEEIHMAVGAAVDVAVGDVAEQEDCRYALDLEGRIWGWGWSEVDGGPPFPGIGDASETVAQPITVVDDLLDDAAVPCPIFTHFAVGEGVLAAVSLHGELFACGTLVHVTLEDGGWRCLMTRMGAPARVRDVLVTRSCPPAIGDGFFPNENGGLWRPDWTADPAVPPQGEIVAGGLLARLDDGTVFAALQQERVPGLDGVVRMSECGPRAVAFLRLDGELVLRGW